MRYHQVENSDAFGIEIARLTVMCGHLPRGDYVRSRTRLFDLPALLLMHRPVRCPYCGERAFAPVFTTCRSMLGKLWMHYAVCALLLLIAGAAVNRELIQRYLHDHGWQHATLKVPTFNAQGN